MSASQTSLDALTPSSTATVFDFNDPPPSQKPEAYLAVPRPTHHRRSSSSSSTWVSISVKTPKSRRKIIAIGATVFLFTSLLALASFVNRRQETIINVSQLVDTHDTKESDSSNVVHVHEDAPLKVAEKAKSVEAPKFNQLDPLVSVNGHPTTRFRDNLKTDLRYVTTFISAGWTNDVMTYANLLYLALITDRIAILPMFTPSHIGGHVPPIAFGDVFDVPRLREALGKPVLEWREVKDKDSELIDKIGCWNIWEAVQYREHHPRWSAVPLHLKLDVSYTRAPDNIKLIPNFEHDQHTTFWALASLAYPEDRKANLHTPLPSPIKNVSLPPDEQLLCFDYMYYVTSFQPFEWEREYAPAWRFVGQHMHWVQPLQDLAEFYVRNAMGIQSEDEPTPPYISIHIRHGDFGNYCGEMDKKDCFASISTIARRVREVRDELWEKKQVVAKQVIMLSDERDEEWWADVKKQGWLAIDHTHTVELYGEWYPLLIDAVIQSGGHGFVGTDRSTMSILAAKRVQSWRGGATRMLKWGTPDADAH